MKKINYSDLNADYLCSVFGEFESEIRDIAVDCGDLPHCLLGDFFNPVLTRMLKNSDYASNAIVAKIFDFYEQLAECGDDEVKNLLQVTLLEYLWDDYIIYSRANEKMCGHTKEINKKIGDYLYAPSKIQQ